ncbi:MAG: M23 family metallopeptidase [Gemmatimonadales bacterium]
MNPGRLAGSLLAALIAARPLPAQQAAQVRWTPDTIRQGTLIRLEVTPRLPEGNNAGVFLVTGRLAGEPLHFAIDTAGTWSALGPVPVGADSALPLVIELTRATGGDTLQLSLPVAVRHFDSEKLSVAPRFGRPPTTAETERIRSDNARAAAVGKGAHLTPRLWWQPFIFPRDSRITARYGAARVFNGQLQSRHLGTDFAGQVGDEIRAANRGVVALVADFLLAGRVVYLDHGEGLTTAYFHMSQALVAAGDTVERGQLIGRVGQSGRVTGPHLHWVFRYGGINVDPLSLEPLGLLDLRPSPTAAPGGTLDTPPSGRSR